MLFLILNSRLEPSDNSTAVRHAFQKLKLTTKSLNLKTSCETSFFTTSSVGQNTAAYIMKTLLSLLFYDE